MKIILYDDNPDFGGHQVMAALGVEALAADPSMDLIFFVHPENRRLKERLAAIPNVRIMESPCATRRLQGIRNRIDSKGIQQLQAVFKATQPDLILCIQGDIEQSSQALIAAHQAGIECVSYLALPHRLATMGAKLGTLRDRFNQSILPLPTRYITISEGMADLLRTRGACQRIDIVPNGIALPPAPGPLHQERPAVFGLLGRIEFSQKQQDFMVRAFLSDPVFKDSRLLIVGSGPDEARLQQMIADEERISQLPWQTDMEPVYGKIDLLIIPSRYEGVPLVMLEALARGIPVIGSNRDGMKEMLPEEWTFETGNAAAMADTFSRVLETRKQHIAPLQAKVMAEHTLECFQSSFVKAVIP